ncbi:MAG: hypothetical protein AB1898_03020 [Acidobacteriota bacterium]
MSLKKAAAQTGRKIQLLEGLGGGDLRSLRNVESTVQQVLKSPSLLGDLVDGLLGHPDPVVRARAADALEKATRGQPQLLAGFKGQILAAATRVSQQEVRWHLAQLFSRLILTSREQDLIFDVLLEFLADQSRIVRTFSMQALADLAESAPRFRPRVTVLLQQLTATGSPAMKARGHKLLKRMARQDQK